MLLWQRPGLLFGLKISTLKLAGNLMRLLKLIRVTSQPVEPAPSNLKLNLLLKARRKCKERVNRSQSLRRRMPSSCLSSTLFTLRVSSTSYDRMRCTLVRVSNCPLTLPLLRVTLLSTRITPCGRVTVPGYRKRQRSVLRTSYREVSRVWYWGSGGLWTIPVCTSGTIWSTLLMEIITRKWSPGCLRALICWCLEKGTLTLSWFVSSLRHYVRAS